MTTEPMEAICRVEKTPGWVYCEVHCGIHRDEPDPYDEGENCLTHYEDGTSSHWPLFVQPESGADTEDWR